MLVYAKSTFGPFVKGHEYELPELEARQWIRQGMMASVATVFPNAGKVKQSPSLPVAPVSHGATLTPSKRGKTRKKAVE